MIRFERLTSDNSSFFDKGMGFYAMSFPLHEQRMEENLINIFTRQGWEIRYWDDIVNFYK